jgi:8-oxo-dGTP diphosphatase
VFVVEGAARAAFPATADPPRAPGRRSESEQPRSRSTGRGAGGTSLEVTVAPGHGDDTIVAEAASRPGPVLVITADRELRARLAAVGASTEGPNWLWSRLDAQPPEPSAPS